MLNVSKKNHPVVLLVTKSSLFLFVLLVGLIGFFVMSVFRVNADGVTIFPAVHSVAGSEVEGGQGAVQYEFVWNDFSTVTPANSVAHETSLKFSWSFIVDEVEQMEVEQVNVVPYEMEAGQNDEAVGLEELTESIDQDLPSELEVIGEEFEIVSTSSSTEEGFEVVDTGLSTVEELLAPEDPVPEEIEMLPEVLPETEENLEIPPVSVSYGLYPLLLEQIIELEPIVTAVQTESSESNVSPDVVTEVVPPETPSVTVSTTSTTTTEAAVSAEVTPFEVLYSLDGTQWQIVGFGAFEMPGEFTFTLQQFSPEELSHLQIMIRYTKTVADGRKIYFDTMRLEFDYGDLLEGEVAGLVDQEPNFTISSTKVDITSGNIRAVLLEKGGMFELWYAITNPATGAVSWSRLANDGSIDPASPLGINGETIFWLDKNQQTIFGFDIKQKSLSGTSFVSDEERDSFLQFNKDNSVLWNAHFNAADNSFEFSKSNKTQ